MQKLFKLVYSATLGILVVVVTKVILDSDPFSELGGQTDALFNTSLFSVIGSIRGDINLLGENSEASEVHVHTPPVGTELETNDQAKLPVLFASGDGTLSLETREQFSELMSSRSRRLREVCDATSETNRKFNFRSFYVLKVNINHTVQTHYFPSSSSYQSRSLVWCPVFKAASTNWMHNLLYLAGKNEFEVEQIMEEHPRQPNEQARVVAPVVDGATLKQMSFERDASNLIIVRHPFER